MEYSDWTVENLQAEKRALEHKNVELQKEGEFHSRNAIGAFAERDHRIIGKGEYDAEGRRHQEKGMAVDSQFSENIKRIAAIENEIQRRS